MKAFSVQTVFSAVDKMTAPIRRINRAVDRMRAPLDRVRGSFAGLGRAAGLGRLLGGMRRLGTATGRLFGQVRGLVTQFGVLGGLAAGGGFVVALKSYVAAGDNIAKTSNKLGLGVAALQELRGAAELSGITVQTFDMAFQRFGRRFAEAIQGTGEAKKVLESMFGRQGLLALKELPAEQAFARVADKVAMIENPLLRNAVAMKLFDSEGVVMVNMLGEGAAGIEALRQRVSLFRGTMSEAAVKAAVVFTDSMTDLTNSTVGVRDAIGEKLIPILQPLVDGLALWLVANRQIIATKIEDIVAKLSAALDSIDWQAVWLGIKNFANGIAEAVDFIGGWQNALIALIAAMNGGLLAAIAAVGLAIVNLGIALAATPVGWFLAAVAAIAAIAFLIVDNWDGIAGFFEDMWAGIRGAFDSGVAWIDARIDDVLSFRGGMKAAGLALIMGFWDGLKEQWGAVAGWLDQKVRDLIGFLPDFVTEGLGLKSATPSAIAGPASARQPLRDEAPPAEARLKGNIVVSIEGAPPGTRVREATLEGGDVELDTEVGYRGLAFAGS